MYSSPYREDVDGRIIKRPSLFSRLKSCYPFIAIAIAAMLFVGIIKIILHMSLSGEDYQRCENSCAPDKVQVEGCQKDHVICLGGPDKVYLKAIVDSKPDASVPDKPIKSDASVYNKPIKSDCTYCLYWPD